jgi:hypothetical protein
MYTDRQTDSQTDRHWRNVNQTRTKLTHLAEDARTSDAIHLVSERNPWHPRGCVLVGLAGNAMQDSTRVVQLVTHAAKPLHSDSDSDTLASHPPSLPLASARTGRAMLDVLP